MAKRTKSEREAYSDGYAQGHKDCDEFRFKVFNDYIWQSSSMFWSFIESIESIDESFCDCDCPNGVHTEKCMTSLFRKDVENLVANQKKLKKEYYIESDKSKTLANANPTIK